MSEISRVALFGKLNSVCYRGIESATVFCKMRGNPYVELIHWLHQMLQLQDSDLHAAEFFDQLAGRAGSAQESIALSGGGQTHAPHEQLQEPPLRFVRRVGAAGPRQR